MYELQQIKNEIKIDGFNSIYYFEFGKNFTHPPEKHNFWEMVYVDSGQIIAVTDGAGCSLSQGDIIFHEPNEIHAHVSDRLVPNNMLVISFTTSSSAMSFFSKKTFKADKTSKTLISLFISEARNALGKIPSNYENKDALDFSSSCFGSTQLLSCYFTEFLIGLIRNSTESSNKIKLTKESRMIAQNSLSELIIEFMHENLHAPLSLHDICNHFMAGKSKLCSIFKNATGESMIEYYNKMKISEAKRLLRSDEYSVSQISDILGYSCIHSFSRTFKKSVGLSPIDYKKTVL